MLKYNSDYYYSQPAASVVGHKCLCLSKMRKRLRLESHVAEIPHAFCLDNYHERLHFLTVHTSKPLEFTILPGFSLEANI